MKTTDTYVIINGKKVLLKDIQKAIDTRIERTYISGCDYNTATIQALINNINELTNKLNITKVNFEYNTGQIHEMVCRELDNMSVDKVQPATYIAMIDAFTTIINEL